MILPLQGTHGLDDNIDVTADARIHHLRDIQRCLSHFRLKIRAVHIYHHRSAFCPVLNGSGLYALISDLFFLFIFFFGSLFRFLFFNLGLITDGCGLIGIFPKSLRFVDGLGLFTAALFILRIGPQHDEHKKDAAYDQYRQYDLSQNRCYLSHRSTLRICIKKLPSKDRKQRPLRFSAFCKKLY